MVIAPGVDATTLSPGEPCGHGRGVRFGFIGETPIAILSASLMPALRWISP
jgi:hypothetical protein